MPTKNVVIGLLFGFAIGLLLIWNFDFHKDRKSSNRVVRSPAQSPVSQNLLADEQNTISVYRSIAPSVVFITSTALQFDVFSFDVTETPRGTGSGFLWDDKGHIVTNYHVIADASSLSVTLSDQSHYEAKVTGADPAKDLAVLKIDAPAKKLKGVPLGSSSEIQVGQKVIAIGNPFGLDETLTVGVVSALGRQIKSVNNRTIHDVIQTDAAINPGNSGGPLLDSSGRLIGVNTAIYSPSGASAGIGFAVPVNTVKQIVPQLVQFGKVIRPGLGVTYLPDYIASRMDIEGVLIATVPSGSAADRAGLKGVQRNWRGQAIAGDIIIGINEEKVTTYDELSNVLEQYKVGDEVTVHYLRDSEKESVRVRLQSVES